MKISTIIGMLAAALCVIGATAALAVIGSSAASADDAGWYLGGNVGQSRSKIDNNRIVGDLLSAGFTTTSIKDDDSHFGYKLFGGYQINKYFALEAGYFDLGRFGFFANTLPPAGLAGNIKIKGANLDAVGLLPFTEKFSAFARIGVNYARANDDFTGYGAVIVQNPERNANKTNYKFGAGLQYAVTPAWGLRAEAERYRVDDAVGNHGDIDLFSVGLLYRFGQSPAPAPLPASSPPPPAAVPEPTVVVVPVPPQTQRYCSILDIQFEINADEMQREETEKLAVLGTFLTKYPDTTAVIEGHTDSVGSAGDNMQLSQRRAQSVVNYLVDTLHIAAARLSAVGYGESRPVADNGTELGKRLNRRIDAVIACATDIQGLTVNPARLTMALLIEFDKNKAEVKPQYHDDLQKVAQFLKANPAVTATVEGHTGNVQATAELQMAISQRRAQSVVDYLAGNFGIDRSRLSAEGFGHSRRFAYNTSLEGQQDNRRVNIIFNYPPR